MSIHRSVRSVLFWTHLAIGLSAGLLILLMSVTGVMLGFERQMIAWIDGAPRVAPATGERLALDTLLARVNVPRETVASITIKRDASWPTIVRMKERGVSPLLVDPFRAEPLQARGDGSGQRFFSALRRWHRWIGAEGQELRAQMKVVNGSANLIFLALVLSGLYLWWPRRWTWPRLRATSIPQWRHRAGHVRDFNWHNSLGFWFALPLALIIASGAFFSFRWPGQYLDLALGNAEEQAAARAALSAPPAPATASTPQAASAATPQPAAESQDASPQGWGQESDAALAQYLTAAIAERPDWTQLILTLPDARATHARIAVAEGNTYRPDLRWTLEVHRSTAQLAAISGYEDLSTARRIRSWVRFGHTGEVFGIGGQLLATFASAVAVLLVWTGFALAWRRLRQLLRRRASVPVVAPLPDASLETPTALG